MINEISSFAISNNSAKFLEKQELKYVKSENRVIILQLMIFVFNEESEVDEKIKQKVKEINITDTQNWSKLQIGYFKIKTAKQRDRRFR